MCDVHGDKVLSLDRLLDPADQLITLGGTDRHIHKNNIDWTVNQSQGSLGNHGIDGVLVVHILGRSKIDIHVQGVATSNLLTTLTAGEAEKGER
jgi:hypothetical protein